MDRLRAYILIGIAGIERELARLALLRAQGQPEGHTMARDMRSLGKEVALFRSESDDAAGKLFDRIDAVRARRDAALKRTHSTLDVEDQAIGDVEKFTSDLERANGGPPLDASPAASRPELPEPQKSWQGASDKK